MPACVGVGLRAPHYAAIAAQRPALAFLEVHSENFFAAGGPALAWLDRFRADYPLSLHGVGLSLGSADALAEAHLARLAALVGRTEPLLVSEHLSWSSIDGRHANDLLPLPFTREAVAHVAARIGRVQDRLKRTILVENVSAYERMPDAEMGEAEFVAAVARRAGCGVLLDVNNVYVNAVNHGFDACAYVDGFPEDLVGEIHLAGHERTPQGLVDTHGARVSPEVWALYGRAVRRFGVRPTLVEWDIAIPPLATLLDEARRAAAACESREATEALA